MYADRYQRAKPNPLSLTAAIGINAALVAALLLSAPDTFSPIEETLEGYMVKDRPPPPPVPEDIVKPEAKATREVRTVTPDRVVDVPDASDNGLIADRLPPVGPIDLGPVAGGDLTVTVDPPKPAPVLVDAAPDPRADFQPDYPPSERRAGIEGAVTVRVLVGVDGRVKAVEGVRSVGDAFFAATRRQALSRWRFKPATRDGVPYESWRTMTVRFVLEE